MKQFQDIDCNAPNYNKFASFIAMGIDTVSKAVACPENCDNGYYEALKPGEPDDGFTQSYRCECCNGEGEVTEKTFIDLETGEIVDTELM